MSEVVHDDASTDACAAVVSAAQRVLAAREGLSIDHAARVLHDDAVEFGIPIDVYAADVVRVFAAHVTVEE